MFLRKKNFKFFLRRNIECTPSLCYKVIFVVVIFFYRGY